jgi:hypothetical protein
MKLQYPLTLTVHSFSETVSNKSVTRRGQRYTNVPGTAGCVGRRNVNSIINNTLCATLILCIRKRSSAGSPSEQKKPERVQPPCRLMGCWVTVSNRSRISVKLSYFSTFIRLRYRLISMLSAMQRVHERNETP